MNAHYSLIGFVPYSDAEISFGQPIFQKRGTSEQYFQIPDHISQYIEKFALSDVESREIRYLDGRSVPISVGKLLMFVAINRDQPCFGNLAQIRPTLESWANLPYSGAGFRLQVSELYNSGAEKKEPRRQVIHRARNTVPGGLASKFLATSLLLNSIWESLQHNIAPDKAATLWESRRDINSKLNLTSEQLFSDSVTEWFQENFDLNIQKIEDEVKSSFPIEMLDNSISAFFSSDDTGANINDYIVREIEKISRSSRQEARVAKLIGRLMASPGMALRILDHYQDRASFANKVVSFLRSHSEEFLLPPRPRFIRYLVERLYKLSYPKQRGILLHELAVVLGEYPEFNDAIRDKVHRVYAEPVSIAEKTIYDQLDHPGKRRGMVRAPNYDYITVYRPKYLVKSEDS